MYIRTDLNRKDLAPILLADTPPSNVRRIGREELSKGGPLSNALTAIWGRDPVAHPGPPNVVLVNEHELRDTLAWLWTYAGDFRPITSITTVLDFCAFKAALELRETPSLNGTANAWLGLIFGEVARGMEGKSTTERLSLSSCASTASFAQARAKALGYDSGCVSRLARTWVNVHSTTGDSASASPNAALVDLFSLLHDLEGASGRVSLDLFRPRVKSLAGTAAFEYFAYGAITESTWIALTEDRTSARVQNSADTSREGRVRTFQSVAMEILSSPSKDERDAFLIAYFASLVSPGSMEHVHLLGTAATLFPSAYYWYGILAGLTKQSSVATANGGLGRRLLREILREFSVLSRPSADIDHAELQLVTDSSRADPTRSSFPGFLTVNLLPGVASIVRQHSNERAQSSGFDSQSDKDILYSLERLERSLMESQVAYERLTASLGRKSQQHLRFSRGKKK